MTQDLHHFGLISAWFGPDTPTQPFQQGTSSSRSGSLGRGQRAIRLIPWVCIQSKAFSVIVPRDFSEWTGSAPLYLCLPAVIFYLSRVFHD